MINQIGIVVKLIDNIAELKTQIKKLKKKNRELLKTLNNWEESVKSNIDNLKKDNERLKWLVKNIGYDVEYQINSEQLSIWEKELDKLLKDTE
jgi:predicted transcriptional regulator